MRRGDGQIRIYQIRFLPLKVAKPWPFEFLHTPTKSSLPVETLDGVEELSNASPVDLSRYAPLSEIPYKCVGAPFLFSVFVSTLLFRFKGTIVDVTAAIEEVSLFAIFCFVSCSVCLTETSS